VQRTEPWWGTTLLTITVRFLKFLLVLIDDVILGLRVPGGVPGLGDDLRNRPRLNGTLWSRKSS